MSTKKGKYLWANFVLSFWASPCRVAMLHGSLSLGPTLRFGLPPYGRHHFAALMRRKLHHSRQNDLRPYLSGFFVLLLGALMFTSCGEDNRTLDKNTRQLVETMARAKVVNMDSTIKKECDQIYEFWYEKTVDSLYKIRRYEIESIRRSPIIQDPLGG